MSKRDRMPTIHVRTAGSADEPALARIFRRASLSNAGDRDALLAHPEALILGKDLIDRGRTRVATLSNGRVIGFATTRPTERGVVELDDLFTDPDVMRQGAARRLVAHLVAEAAADRVHRIDVTANPHALAFYRAVGFVDDGQVATQFGPGHRMHLDVADAPRERGAC